MAGNQSMQGLRDAIARGLSTCLAVDRDTPERLKILLRQLELAEEEVADKERTSKRTRDDRSS